MIEDFGRIVYIPRPQPNHIPDTLGMVEERIVGALIGGGARKSRVLHDIYQLRPQDRGVAFARGWEWTEEPAPDGCRRFSLETAGGVQRIDFNRDSGETTLVSRGGGLQQTIRMNRNGYVSYSATESFAP